MKKMLCSASAILMLMAAVSSCTKETKSVAETVSEKELAKIEKLGFSTENIKKVGNDYLVEGDIMLSVSDLDKSPQSPNMIVAQEEQYRTFNLVNTTKYPAIKVALNNSSANHEAAFSAALDEVIRRYDALGTKIDLQRVATGANINVVAFYEVSNTLGSAGFPTSGGDPYNQVRMNTYHYSPSTSSTNVDYIATIIAHEIGHCIGFRHTDYANRAYSCGGRRSNEGQANNGVGAVHIPGTPTGGDPNSWMLACIGDNVNRPFNANDITALNYVYKK